MPRGPRISYPNAVFHVINRFVDRHPFFKEKRDYDTFLKIYFDVAETFGIRTYGYDLMPNHFHIVLETPTGDISRFLQRFLTRTVQFLNKRRGRVGHLLQGRTKTLIIEKSAYFSTVIGYVLLNRVRAGLAQNIFADEYNSVGEMLTSGKSRLAREPLWEHLFGHPFDERRMKAEIRLCRDWLKELDPHSNEEEFTAGHRGSFLGSDKFREAVLRNQERRKAATGKGFRRQDDRPERRWTWREMIQACEEAVGKVLWQGKWRNRETAVRHLSWYVAATAAGWDYATIRVLQAEPGCPHSRYTMAISRIRASKHRRDLAERVIKILLSKHGESVKVSE